LTKKDEGASGLEATGYCIVVLFS